MRRGEQVERTTGRVPRFKGSDFDRHVVATGNLGHAQVRLNSQDRTASLQDRNRHLAGPAAHIENIRWAPGQQVVDKRSRVGRPVPVVLLGGRSEGFGSIPIIMESVQRHPSF